VYGITIISDDEVYGCCLIYVSVTADKFIGLPIALSCCSCRRAAKITVVGLTGCFGERESEQVSAVVAVQTLLPSHHHHHHHSICLTKGPQLRINNQQDASSIQNFILSRNSTCIGHLLCPSSGVISCARGNWYVSCRLCGRCTGESGCSQELSAVHVAFGMFHAGYVAPAWECQVGTPHVSGIYCAHHQELSAVHVAIGMFHAGYVASA
jgi:hypothetical protein